MTKVVWPITMSLDGFIGPSGNDMATKYVVILGADVARQCPAAGELDEILVHRLPVLLGNGVRLFEHAGGPHVRLERPSLSATPLVTNLWFRVRR